MATTTTTTTTLAEALRAHAEHVKLDSLAMAAERNGNYLSAEAIRERRDRRWAEYNRTGIYPVGW